jgi:hypothetical protein
MQTFTFQASNSYSHLSPDFEDSDDDRDEFADYSDVDDTPSAPPPKWLTCDGGDINLTTGCTR